MKKLLKKIKKKDEGFTLVELLAVIVILGIIIAIAVPAVGNVINKSQKNADEAEVALIEDAARLAIVSSNIKISRLSYIYVDVLVESGYLDNRDGLNEKAGAVRISDEGKKYTYFEDPGNIVATETISLQDLNNYQ